jgi:hypothetical protein
MSKALFQFSNLRGLSINTIQENSMRITHNYMLKVTLINDNGAVKLAENLVVKFYVLTNRERGRSCAGESCDYLIAKSMIKGTMFL